MWMLLVIHKKGKTMTKSIDIKNKTAWHNEKMPENMMNTHLLTTRKRQLYV